MTPSNRSMIESLDQAFLDGAALGTGLLREEAVHRHWTEPSALPGMSVGALSCHLARQVSRAAELLRTPSALPVLTSVDEHYARAAWVTASSPDDPANSRSSDDAEAARGHTWMLQRLDADLLTAEQ